MLPAPSFRCALALLALMAGLVSPAAELPIATTRLASGLSKPIFLTAPPGDTTRVFVAEQHSGQVRIVSSGNGTVSPSPFLTEGGLTTGGEQGLLGLAFHPGFASNGHVYLVCTKDGGGPGGHSELVRYTANPPFATATSVDPSSRLVVLRFDQPQDNHNGGWIGFGNDGHLYMSSGDGGGGGDDHGSNGNGQDLGNLLGKILRLDVDSAAPYAIPPGNMDGTGVRREIFAFGLRNPWRCSIDRATGAIWIGDVGQGSWEEIDYGGAGVAGRNYGWRRYEGDHDFNTGTTLAAGYPAVAPVTEYDRGSGQAIVGGYVYRGSAIPALQGTYLYADFSSGRFFSFTAGAGTATDRQECTSRIDPGGDIRNPSSLGEDAAGELYICDYSNGRIHKIVPLLDITTAAVLPAATVGMAWSVTLAATGGATPYTWSLDGGSSLPAGLSLSTAGVVSGSPTAAGDATFTIRVVDAAGVAATRTFSLHVNPALSITTGATLPGGSIAVPYAGVTFTATGGTGARTWEVSGGTLPPGLALSSAGVLAGTPIAAGSHVFTLLVRDGLGATATAAFTLEVEDALTVATTSLPADTIAVPYDHTLAAAGGDAPYGWSLTAGALPAGLGLASDGRISGTPTAAGTASFTVRVVDAGSASATRDLAITINPDLAITTSSLPAGQLGVPYHQALASTGGTAPVTWSIASGALPGGLALTPASGVISGTPTTATTGAAFTARVSDAVGVQRDAALAIAIGGAPAITSTAITTADVGAAYTYDVEAAGDPPPTFALVTGPPGMSIDAATGVIAWTPATAGSAAVSVSASNGMGPDALQSFTITVSVHGIVDRPPAAAYLGMPTSAAGAIPALLSATGVLSDSATLTPVPALIPYSVNTPFWSDGAHKTRWISLPNDGQPYTADETVDFSPTGEWTFPAGTVLVKHFDLATDQRTPAVRRRIETRILVRAAAGGVYGVTYRWRDDHSDAEVVTSAQTGDLVITDANGSQRTQTWYYPSPSDCLQCHTPNAQSILGVNTRQLNGTYTYPVSGIGDNQLRTWNHLGLFTGGIDEQAIAGHPRLSAIEDSGAALEQRARSYLDSNCAYCHRPGGAQATFDARYDTPLANQGLIDGRVNNDLGIAGAEVVVPRDTARSVLYLRIHTDDPARRMPPLGSTVVDQGGATLIAQWIAAMDDGGNTPGGGAGGGATQDDGGSSGCGAGSLATFLAFLMFGFAVRRLRP
jgi:uncharacterized repeat protein (TIGR03806 family)